MKSAPPTEASRPEFAVREAGDRPPVPTRRRPRRALLYSLFALGAAVLIIGGLWSYVSGGRYVATTDAYVQSNVLTVSTDVSGIVDRIYVSEGQHVNKGQILFRQDSDKFRIALDNARANVAQTALTRQSLKAE